MHHISNLLKTLAVCLVLIPSLSNAQDVQGTDNAITRLWPTICDDAETMTNVLKGSQFEEQLIMLGQQNAEIFITIWINRDTQTFTILATNKSMMESCILTMGKGMSWFDYVDTTRI